MKDMIISEKVREKEGQLIVGNAIKLVEIVKMSYPIDLGGKYMWTISNTNINVIKDLRLTNMKKY